jgi:hypothetical protein
MEAMINTKEFMNELESRGLLVVRAIDLENLIYRKGQGVNELREKCLKKKALTFKEIIDAQFFDIKSKNTLKYWCDQGKIRPEEVIIDEQTGVRRVLTIAVIRICKNEGLGN